MEKKYKIIFISITIILLILIKIIISYIKSGYELNNLNNMNKDISILEDAIALYYLNNSSLPTNENKIEFYKKYNINDGEDYYEIDLNKLNNLKLVYGSQKNGNEDKYIINHNSHTIYYLKGVKYNNEIYYTKENIDYTYISLEDYK